MNQASLRRLFRRVLLASVVPLPIATGSLSCGSSTGVGSNGGDGVGGEAGAGGTQSGSGGYGGGQGGSTPVDACGDQRTGCSICVVLDAGTVVGGGPLTPAECQSICGSTMSCSLVLREGQAAAVRCQLSCLTGRRPAGLVEREPSKAEVRGVGDYFAEMALLEAASVDAFHVLRDELRHHGAPGSLVRAAERAAKDEVRHARTASALARRYGSAPRLPRVVARSLRSLESIALENATEGCVRETFGALLAAYQASAASDPVLRAAFATIAKDETRHAALAWRVAAWLDTKLDPDARERVEEARRTASEEVAAIVRVEPTEQLREVGLPEAEVASRMAEQMKTSLWLTPRSPRHLTSRKA